ncbi:TonB-dependent receptor [Sulfurimonas diazotrophicus]|uniref:TonB-dependent receptor n=1 Tax=Sulfurimonas diazotrophicus TaxID=3131939 RepID=A0ABZ3H7G5_9BACT
MKLFYLSLAAAVACSGLNAENVVKMGDLTVTATKIEQDTFESPASVSVVTAKTIEEKSVQRADQALKDLPGVYVRALGGNLPSNFSNTVTLRGIPGYYRTAVLVDGIALNDAFSGAVNWSSIAVDDIDQIEVVSGPFSSLYGGNAMGGVINVITKKPTKTQLSAKIGLGSNQYKSEKFLYRSKLGEKLGIALNYERQDSDGYISDKVVKTFSSGSGTTPVTGWKKTTNTYGDTAYILGDKGRRSWWSTNAGLKLFYDIDERSELRLGASQYRYETDFEHFNTYLRDGAGTPIYSGNVEIDDNGPYNKTISEKDFLFGPNGQDITKYTLEYKIDFENDITVKADAAYTEYDYWYISQASGATISGGSGSISEIPSKKTYGALQASFPIGQSHLVVAGVDFNKNELSKKTTNLTNWRYDGSKTDLTYHSDGQSTTQAVFFQDEILLGEKWSFYIGGRYDYWKTDGTVRGYGTSPYVLPYPSRNDSQFSPKVSAVYRAGEKATIRASVGSAFRAPTLSDLYSSWLASNGKLSQANPNLKPEKTTSWEIGFEQQFDSKTLVRATYYENYLTDLIYTTDVNATLSEKRNAGKAEIKGVELSIKQELIEGIDAFINYTYTDAKIVKNSAVPASEGKRVTYTPEHQFNLGMNVSKGAWSGSLIGSYVGDVTTKDDNSDTVKNVYGGFQSYFVADAKIAYDVQENLGISLAVNNLLDREYYQYYLMPGRTFYGELSFKF